MDKLEFTNKVLTNLNNCMDEFGKVDLTKFTNLTNKQYEAINYNQCSTQLKSVDMISFEEWKKVFVVQIKDNLFELRGSILSSETLRFAYSKNSTPLTEEEVQELRNKAKKYAESGGKYLNKQETK